jgi:hypothetical protein
MGGGKTRWALLACIGAVALFAGGCSDGKWRGQYGSDPKERSASQSCAEVEASRAPCKYGETEGEENARLNNQAHREAEEDARLTPPESSATPESSPYSE